MSGLVKFLNIWREKDGGKTTTTSGQHTTNNNDEDEYHQSLLSTTSTHHHDDDASSSPQDASQTNNTATDNDNIINYHVWRKQKKKELEHYFSKRIVEKNDDDSDDDDDQEEESEEYVVPDNDEMEVPYWSTQQEEVAASQQQQQQTTTLSPTGLHHHKTTATKVKAIPHTSETTHSATRISQISMYTKDLSLGLCRMEKIWPLRTMKREDDRAGPVDSFEEDGPYATLFKKGLSVQVTQLLDQNKNNSKYQQPPLLGRHDKPPQQLRIFFYGKYAEVLSDFFATTNDVKLALFSFENIPAKCIVPYPARNWFDEEFMVPYAVCIGDRSNMKMSDDEGVMVRFHFDSPELVVKAARLPFARTNNKNMEELTLTSESIQDSSGTVTWTDSSELEKRYQAWEAGEVAGGDEKQEEEKEEEEDAGVIMDDDDDDDDEKRPPSEPAAAAAPASAAVRQEREEGEEAAAPSAQEPPCHRETQPSAAGRKRSDRVRDEVDAEALPSPRAKRPKTAVVYHRLNELLQVIEQYEPPDSSNDSKLPKVNVHGVVLAFSSPRMTKRQDWMMSVTLIDESLPLPETGTLSEPSDDSVACVTLVIFCKKPDGLPKLRKAGDILRLHRVEAQIYNDEVQLQGRRASSYLVARPKDDDATDASLRHRGSWEFIPTAKKQVTFEPQDTQRCAELWKWSRDRFKSYPTMKFSQRFKLKDFARQEQSESTTESRHGDITLMVSVFLTVPPALRSGTSPIAFLRVWDGTGPPRADPLPVATTDAAVVTRLGDPPPQALVAIKNIIDGWNSEPTDHGSEAAQSTAADIALRPPKALCGRVANVAIWEQAQYDLLEEIGITPGTFIRLRNAHESKLASGLRCLNVSHRTWLTPLPEETYEIRVMLEEHHARVQMKEPFNKSSGLLPLEGEAQVRANTTAAPLPPPVQSAQPTPELTPCIARCIADPAPNSLKFEFRITGTEPVVEQKDNGLCKICCDGAPGSIVYQFAVHIQDVSGEIHAICSDEVGESLFGMKADVAAQMTAAQVKDVMEKLTNQDARWQGQIQSVELNGQKFFILQNPSVCQNEAAHV